MPDLADHQRTRAAVPPKLPQGLDAVANSIVGGVRRSVSLSGLRAEAEEVGLRAEAWRDSKDGHLAEEIRRLRAEFRRRAETTREARHEALALCFEIARRRLGLTPHPEQVMGAIAIGRGFLIEMATGEGKTLTIALAAVASGWTRRPVHILTANDYLAERDAKALAKYYKACGVSVAHVIGGMPPEERRQGYEADIVYTTAKEIVADFLRDRLRLGVLSDPGRRLVRAVIQPRRVLARQIVMRGLHTAIVDEADHAMIDEAVTPLVISRQTPNPVLVEASRVACRLAGGLSAGEDYTVDRRYKEVQLTRGASERVAGELRSLPGIWQGRRRGLDLVRQALQAREFFHEGEQFVVVDGKVVIVDESTGRMMPQRSWSEGLHQAVEAKEGLEVTAPAETLARLSFQRFFRLFFQLSGLTGTAHEAAGEFWQIYRLPVLRIPHHRPCIREHLPDRVFADEASKWAAVTREILRRHATGQPVLVGTRSVEASEKLAGLLEAERVVFRVLNATRDAEEAAIVRHAGEEGKITIATNMAGRGTDIRLGPGVAARGGLHVIATERHESRRVDRQLFGRSGRQGDPGSAQAFVSFEDELLRRHLRQPMRQQVRRMLSAGVPGSTVLAASTLRFAQKSSERMAYQQRRAVLRNDTKLDESLGFTVEG